MLVSSTEINNTPNSMQVAKDMLVRVTEPGAKAINILVFRTRPDPIW